jgi:uncharacterized protein (DUF427 family)
MTMRAVWNNVILAESEDTRVVKEYHYFPPDDVRWEHLERSRTHIFAPMEGHRELPQRHWWCSR